MAAVVFNSLSLLRGLLGFLKPYPAKNKYGLPLPPECHIVLSDEDIGNRPIMIIGDVHGCYDELENLISKAQNIVNTSDIYFIFVGDMVNKGPKNLEVLTLVRSLAKKGIAAAVKGNHEESLLREYRSMCQDKDYKLSSKYQYLKEFSTDDFNFLHNLPYSLSIPKINSIVVHAGLVPGVPLSRQCLIDLCHMRNVVYDVHFWDPVLTGNSKVDEGVAWASMWKGPQHVYYGHDARRGLQDLPHATGLDTGCVYGLNLTGILITSTGERHFVSVPAKQSYYS
ncbi:unnamed protein product [Candidula unifasciata]|uniref:Calcineurin-like phosphoesterase domain-containing protein n=1 Tax=Candidula unifasciata TaxID=100452 RepID=A0A8S3ZP13_9EUPU|nr:unnamed protein product [Candidula unifasciata]